MALRCGDFRHRIAFQNPAACQDLTPYGEKPKREPVTVAEDVPAEVKQLSGRELFTAQHVDELVTTRVRLHWLAGIDATLTIEFEGKTLNIVSATNPDGQRQELLILAYEKKD